MRTTAQPNYYWRFPLSSCIVIKTNKCYKIKKGEGKHQRMCSWLVTEVVQYFLKQGSHPIITLLDYKAAFDSCKFDILFSMVLETGVPPIVVRALMYSYQQQYAWVRWGKARSNIFPIKNSTRQGSIASPVLWSI